MFTNDKVVLGILIFLCVLLIALLRLLLKKKNKKHLHKAFILIFILMLTWLGVMILQILFMDKFNINIKYFFNFYYISLCFLPIALLFMALAFEKNTIVLKRIHILLLIIPILSVILVWTNDAHHLVYKEYSLNISTDYGWYFYVHTFYTYALFAVSCFILIKYSIKNAGFFSKQAILIIIGILIPLVVNILGSLQIVEISIYATPITLAITIACFTFAIIKFDLFKITPIAMQRIVDRISDSFIVVNDDNIITDFNNTFLKTFNLKAENIRNLNFIKFINSTNLKFDVKAITKILEKCQKTERTIVVKQELQMGDSYFNVEASGIFSGRTFLGTLFLFKDITQHMHDVEIIKDNQNILIERERLASLGQMIGGIAHNLKTPIMSISGAAEGLSDLIDEYSTSVGDPEVTNEDHQEIANDMRGWISKIQSHLSYMSDVITTVKGQAVTFSENASFPDFTIGDLIRHINILMKHELSNALIELEEHVQIDKNTSIKGNINSLVQVINNMISNAIQAYNGKTGEKIILSIYKEGKDKLVISIQDFAGGLPDTVKNKLFKEMITTKGKAGTGLGLFMSYSNIRAHFNGDINFDTAPGKGTIFYIEIPV